MSLLMDALKKAEIAKRQGASSDDQQPLQPVDFSGLTLEPAQARPRATMSDLPSLEPVLNGEVDSSPPPAHPPSPPALPEPSLVSAVASVEKGTATEPITLVAPKKPHQAEPVTPTQHQAIEASAAGQQRIADDRKNAENLFRAKLPEKNSSSKKTFAIALGGMTLLASSAIGVYFWWQLQPKNGLGVSVSSTQTTRPASAPAASAPPALPAPLTPEAPSAQPTIAATPGTTGQAMAASSTPATVGASSTSVPPAVQLAAPAATTRQPANNARRSDDDDEDRPIRLTKSPLRVNPELARGFDAVSRGDRASAYAAYSAVLASDPQNTDALHGMADLALRASKLSDAERYLQQVLVANPRDATALAGLTNLYARNNPAKAEGRLKALAEAQPEHSAPHIALGNLYIVQGRWQEAQQSYFTAYASQPDNPDVLFNLAISLEHLHQPRLAEQYYREALQASKRRPASFTAAQVEERLSALQP